MVAPHVSISAEKLFDLGPLPVTNSLLMTWIVLAVFLILGIWIRLTLKNKPQGLQNIFEILIESWLNIIESVTGNAKQTRIFFSTIVTIFLFVLFNNWGGLIPGVGSIGIVETAEATGRTTEALIEKAHGEAGATDVVAERRSGFTHIFRAASADLSFTLTLAIIAVILTQYHGIRQLGGWGYLKRFLNFHKPFPVMLFVGLLEFVLEFAKIISFGFRLFGNIFAGEVLLAVMISLVPFVVPMPFYGLEIFVGAVQALVFSMLTLVFFKTAVTDHDF